MNLPPYKPVELNIGRANPSQTIALIRQLVHETDWAVAPDSPLSPQEKQKYEKYRNDLWGLDISLPIEQIIWPTKP